MPFTAARTFIAHIWQYPPPRDLETVAPFEFRDTAPLINYDQI